MRPSALPTALVVALAVTMGAVLIGLVQRGAPTPVPPVVTSQTSPAARALAVLHAWDAERSQAWSHGDTAALQALYLPGSTAGAEDVAMLRAWQQRGLRVHELRMQVLRADVRVHRRDRIVVRVLERMARGWAQRAPSARVEVPLPTTTPSTRTITLVRRDGRWCVAEVRLSAGRWPAPR